jgi:hypothetical protein
MANDDHIAQLRKGVAAWNAWRPEREGRSRFRRFAPDLSEANLSGADLRDAKLGRANLFEAKLEEANLNSADLSGADLVEAGLGSAYPPASQPKNPRRHRHHNFQGGADPRPLHG